MLSKSTCMCSSCSSVRVVWPTTKKIQEKKEWNNLIFFYRYIRDTPSDRSDRANGQPRTKEQSRSLPRIPLSVGDLLVKIKYLNLFFCQRPSININHRNGKKFDCLLFRTSFPLFFLSVYIQSLAVFADITAYAA